MNLYEAANAYREQLKARDVAATSRMATAYGDAWRAINERLSWLLEQYEAEQDAGRQPPIYWLYLQDRLQSLKEQAQTALLEFVSSASDTVQREQAAVVKLAREHSVGLFQAALGDVPAGVSVNFNKLPKGAFEDLVGFLSDGTPLKEHLIRIAPAGVEQIERGLLQGVALGQNPRKIARAIKGEFDGGFAQALRVSRTETLRSYRSATLRSYEANGEVVSEWVWLANLGSWQRTCAACLAMNGRVMPTNVVQGTHVNCRCTIIARPKPLSEILNDPSIPDTRPKIEDGEAWFRRQPEERQRWILGEKRLAAWKAGQVTLADFVQYTDDPRWGPTRTETSLKGALENANARKTYGRDPAGAKPLALSVLGGSRVDQGPADDSDSNGGPSSVGFNAGGGAAHPRIAAAEAAIAPIKSHEIGLAFTDDGTEVYRKSGGPRHVPIPDEDLPRIKDHIFTHNHPSGLSFSIGDLKHIPRIDAKEFRATGINDLGEHHTYSFRRPATGWGVSSEEAVNIGLTADTEASVLDFSDALAGRTDEELTRGHAHRRNEILAQKLGWTYERTKLR